MSDASASSNPDQAPAGGAAADSVALSEARLTVPERLERLRELKALMIQRRAEVEARAQLFLQRIGGELA